MFMDKMGLIRCFEHTEKLCKEKGRLRKAIEKSIEGTKFYAEGDTPPLPAPRFDETGVSVRKGRSFETAMAYREKFPKARIAVHDFAFALTPGGGVREGSLSQEASLCRCSTLLSALDTKENASRFYNLHNEQHNKRYTDACIWIPDILIIKTDDLQPMRLLETQWTSVDILACAAPYSGENPMEKMDILGDDERLFSLHVQRGRHLLSVAAANRADILILGAFGCGVLKNSPEVVAESYRHILPEFNGQFQEVAFAIYQEPHELDYFRAFVKAFDGR